MKRQQFYLPQSGKLVTQLPRGITFAYDLCLGRLRDYWKGIPWLMPKKCRLGPQNGPRILGPEKLLKNANLK